MKKRIVSLILSVGLLVGLALSVNASTFSGFDALTPEDPAVFTATTPTLIIPSSTTATLIVTTLTPTNTFLTSTPTSTLTITAMGNAEEDSSGIFLISGASAFNAVSPTTSTLTVTAIIPATASPTSTLFIVTSSTISTLTATADVFPITPSATTTLTVTANVGGGDTPIPVPTITMASTPTITNPVPQMTENEIQTEIIKVATLIVQLMQEWVRMLASS